MAQIDPDVKQNYQDLHESTGESYESIARRVNAHGDPDLASWLRSRAKGEEDKPEDQQRSDAPQGRLPVKQETAAADAKPKEAAAKK